MADTRRRPMAVPPRVPRTVPPRVAECNGYGGPQPLDGVLGGFSAITEMDLQGSRRFVEETQRLTGIDWRKGAACECGAGIGRVSQGLLVHLTDACHLVEASASLLAAAPDFLNSGDGPEDFASRCRFYCSALQDWQPAKGTYSIVWIQWVFCYLTDEDAIAFLQRCADSLVDGGVIVLKENTTGTRGDRPEKESDDDNDDSGVDFVVDTEDASLSRSVRYLHWIADEAGLETVHASWQADLPDELYPVYQLALQSPQ